MHTHTLDPLRSGVSWGKCSGVRENCEGEASYRYRMLFGNLMKSVDYILAWVRVSRAQELKLGLGSC